jgi:hypothetical protein
MPHRSEVSEWRDFWALDEHSDDSQLAIAQAGMRTVLAFSEDLDMDYFGEVPFAARIGHQSRSRPAHASGSNVSVDRAGAFAGSLRHPGPGI